MCTRFYIDADSEHVEPYLTKAKASPLMKKYEEMGKKLLLTGEIFPTDVAATIAPGRDGNPSIFPMIWGFESFNKKPIINARTETAFEKPMFMDSWKNRRCIIPVSNYFEWEHLVFSTGRSIIGMKYSIKCKQTPLTYLCGLYTIRDNIPYFTILTREPGERLAKIHDRMPLILPKKLIREWLKTPNPELLVKDSITNEFTTKRIK